MSENRPDPGPSSADDIPSPDGAYPAPPDPFSREGSDPAAPATPPASPAGSSALNPDNGYPSSSAATPEVGPQSWPGYPTSVPEASWSPGNPTTPPPYGAPPVDQGYGQPPAGCGSPPQTYSSNPYAPAPDPYQVANPYQPSYGGYSPYGVAPIQHPKATSALIFGIVGLVLSLSCGIGGLLGIGGIINGRKARGDIDADPQRYVGRGVASAGFGLGLAGTIIGVLVTIALIIAIAAGVLNS